MTFTIALVCLGLCAVLASCACDKVLVLLSDKSRQSGKYSRLFTELEERNEVHVKEIGDNGLQLQHWGEWLYDGIFVLAEDGEAFGGAMDGAYLIDFFESGRSVLLAAQNPSPDIREAASELGADYVEPGMFVQDLVRHNAAEGPHAILTSVSTNVSAIARPSGAPVVYAGSAFTTSPDASLSCAVLRAEHTATLRSNAPAGNQLALVLAAQARNNARAVVVASTRMFADEAFDSVVVDALSGEKRGTANLQLARDLIDWAFKRRAVLHMSSFNHHREGESLPPPQNTYSVNDVITVELDLMEENDGVLTPHVTDSLQVQYVMLDPYVRQAMQHMGGGHYSLTFRAPDVYGVFKWVLDYKKQGYTFLQLEEVAPLRPLRHNEYPRFIAQAYPYYATLFVLSCAFVIVIWYVKYLE